MKLMKTLTIIKNTGLVFLFILFFAPAFAQDDEDSDRKKPVRAPFESSLIIDQQTVVVPGKGTMQMDIQHRFGTFANGSSDFWGLWAPSNIRLGMGYSIIDDLSVGIGATKFNSIVDLNAKWNFLKQTRSWSVPVGLTYYGVVGFDTRNPDLFSETLHRISYFNEIIIATRFSPKVSLQVAPSMSHYNAVDSLYSNDIFAISFSGRYKFSGQSSVIFGYDQQLNSHEKTDAITGKTLPRPNLSLGIEIGTSSHAFQIFVANFQKIINQNNMVYNTNDFTQGIDNFLLGFNITRLWGF